MTFCGKLGRERLGTSLGYKVYFKPDIPIFRILQCRNLFPCGHCSVSLRNLSSSLDMHGVSDAPFFTLLIPSDYRTALASAFKFSFLLDFTSLVSSLRVVVVVVVIIIIIILIIIII